MLTKEQVLKILAESRPDLTEQDWNTANVLSVLRWLLPQEWKQAEIRIEEFKD